MKKINDLTNSVNDFEKPVIGVEAIYTDQHLKEYNDNLLIQALPPIFDTDTFIDLVSELPEFNDFEVNLDRSIRFHCIYRLSSYFDPQDKTIELNTLIGLLIRRGYIARNPSKSAFVLRSRQIYEAIKKSDFRNLEKYVTQPTSASGITLIGLSGMGKSTNLSKILSLYPQVIFHRQLSTHQIVWLKIDCPHAGSLKGLCNDIFSAIDLLLGTNYSTKFTSRNSTEDLMLGQVVQLVHTYHLGLLVIDEIQSLANAHRGKDDLLNFLVKMDNVIGVPVVRIGTKEALSILQGNFRNARRGLGEVSLMWDRMQKDEHLSINTDQDQSEWKLFINHLWEYQWTKTRVCLSPELEEVFYEETQGIIDIAVKLFKMIQYRCISLEGDEAITVEIVKDVAKDGLRLVKPMLDAIRNNDMQAMEKYKDIAPLDITEFEQQCFRQLSKIALNQKKKSNDRTNSHRLKAVIAELLALELDFSPLVAKECAERIISEDPLETDISKLVRKSCQLALSGYTKNSSASSKSTKRNSSSKKLAVTYQKDDLRVIVENSIEANMSAYVEMKSKELICDPIAEYI
jgi:hypothetical protein